MKLPHYIGIKPDCTRIKFFGSIEKLFIILCKNTCSQTVLVVIGLTYCFIKILKYNEAILRKLPVNLIEIDSHYRIKIVNETIESFSGLSADKLTESDAIKLINNSLINKTSQACFETKIVLNKQEKICKVNTLPIMNGNHCIGVIILLDDITEQEDLRRKLILSQNISSVWLLAAGVAHEVNNPLEIINYLLKDITDKTDSDQILKDCN